VVNKPTLTPDEMMRCKCGNRKFYISLDSTDVECMLCGQWYHLGRHLFSGCADWCGMMYPYEQDPEDGEWYWFTDKGGQDWTQEQKALSPSGYLGNDTDF